MFSTVTLQDWTDIQRYARPYWLFRGQRNASWQLQTSLERCCDRLGKTAQERPVLEERMIREFRRAYHQFSGHVPERNATIEWLSIMQHHGAPTRLLDFTYSIYVAAYFALEDADDTADSAVWAIQGPWALQRAVALLESAGKKGARRMLVPFMDDAETFVRTLFLVKPYVTAASPITPFRLNERLRVQQGTFVMQGDITKSFPDNLARLSGGKTNSNVLKIVIPRGIRLHALQQLWSMDISSAALFPGLDGFARSLGVNHSLFNPTPWAQPTASPRRRRRGTSVRRQP